VQLFTGAQINFGDLNPYLTYGLYVTIFNSLQLVVHTTLSKRLLVCSANSFKILLNGLQIYVGAQTIGMFRNLFRVKNIWPAKWPNQICFSMSHALAPTISKPSNRLPRDICVSKNRELLHYLCAVQAGVRQPNGH
jgi:hypothetical protein